jgi:hypothetical protein
MPYLAFQSSEPTHNTSPYVLNCVAPVVDSPYVNFIASSGEVSSLVLA